MSNAPAEFINIDNDDGGPLVLTRRMPSVDNVLNTEDYIPMTFVDNPSSSSIPDILFNESGTDVDNVIESRTAYDSDKHTLPLNYIKSDNISLDEEGNLYISYHELFDNNEIDRN